MQTGQEANGIGTSWYPCGAHQRSQNGIQNLYIHFISSILFFCSKTAHQMTHKSWTLLACPCSDMEGHLVLFKQRSDKLLCEEKIRLSSSTTGSSPDPQQHNKQFDSDVHFSQHTQGFKAPHCMVFKTRATCTPTSYFTHGTNELFLGGCPKISSSTLPNKRKFLDISCIFLLRSLYQSLHSQTQVYNDQSQSIMRMELQGQKISFTMSKDNFATLYNYQGHSNLSRSGLLCST